MNKERTGIADLTETKKFVSPQWNFTYTGTVNGKAFSFFAKTFGGYAPNQATTDTLTDKEIAAVRSGVRRFVRSGS